MNPLPTVLIFTYPEHGQANANLAISYELLLAGVDVYIASFAPLKTRVARLRELINRRPLLSRGTTGSITFRQIDGVLPYVEAVQRYGINPTTIRHTPGVSGALGSFSKMDIVYFPWSQEEYSSAINSCKEVITTVKPNLVVVDTLFYSAMDACKLAGQKFMVIFPTGLTSKDAVLRAQPYLAALWKYPILSSGFPFPLKWWQVPLNIYLYVRLVIQMVVSANIKRTSALRRSLGLTVGFGCYPGVEYICPSLPEIDFPFAVIPKEILLCGPIVMPFDPLAESDPELRNWLENGSTILVNLGSHVVCDEKFALEMVSALRILFDFHDRRRGSSKIQVLWKVKGNEDVQKVIDEVLGEHIREGRVKVVAWLDVEPVSILQHPNVVCTVHHGGANSFYEGVWSGVPQVVLPVWYDTYSYARLAEYLKIGLFGSETSAPGVRAEEFGKALLRVTGGGEETDKFRISAKHLKGVCRAKGNGREAAAMAILKEAGIMK